MYTARRASRMSFIAARSHQIGRVISHRQTSIAHDEYNDSLRDVSILQDVALIHLVHTRRTSYLSIPQMWDGGQNPFVIVFVVSFCPQSSIPTITLPELMFNTAFLGSETCTMIRLTLVGVNLD